jgi:flavin reductase (DIM6/NTAB) family NADH-FMN oxidoreductase RutF
MHERADDPGPAFDRWVAASRPAMVVVTAAVGDQRDGCLVGFHSQCSIEPRRYALWLSELNRTTRLVADPACSHVAVHGLGADQHELARHFGALTGDRVEKLGPGGPAWHPGPGGAPLLDACPDRLVGRTVALVEVDADHRGLVVEPVEASASEAGGAARDWLRMAEVMDLVAGHRPDEASRDHP